MTNNHKTPPLDDDSFAARIERAGKKIINHGNAIDLLGECTAFIEAVKLTGGHDCDDLLARIVDITKEYNELQKGRV